LSLLSILILILASLLIGVSARGRWRTPALMLGSLLAIYWMQPSTPIRHLDFWFPTATIALSALVWAATRPTPAPPLREALPSILLIAGTIIVIGLLRYLGPFCCLTTSRPPALLQVLLVLLVSGVVFLISARFFSARTSFINLIVFLILGIFIILKTEYLAQLASTGLRALTGQSAAVASAFDLRWLGFSYVAFRLIHALRDRIAGRLPEVTLAEFLVFIIFFPAFTAGPIDRIQRFIQDLRKPFHLDAAALYQAGQRLIIGIFSKFVLADTLAIIALNDTNASQTFSTGWLWILVYAYTFRIYFDFSGYTDIAIGMGRLLGFQLPDNFNRPYRKSNLTQFWNSWHITLAQWFRAYYFNPLTRALRASPRGIPMPWIIFFGQTTTFLLLGLWHGITWNFVIWGLWHGVGLFVHNRWSEFMRPCFADSEHQPGLKRALDVGGVLLTFHYVALGWVWFALSQADLSWQVFLRLFGLAGGG
jgi:D-alanyl-lipoteichoic acid acyltransferase DltB (MBOAT superfamily)